MRQLWLLGPAHVEIIKKAHSETTKGPDDSLPRFRSRRTVGLLGYLAAERRVVARDHLLALFWPAEQPAKSRANLSRELHNLKEILPGCWDLDRQTAAFIPTADTLVDLDQLRYLEKEEQWVEGAELLGGEFLEGLHLNHNPEFENWLFCERKRWREFAEAVLRRVIKGHARRGRYADALRCAWRLLQHAPWDEEAHRWVIRLLAWTGQRGDALRHYETCQQTMWEELGVHPGTETVVLYQQIQDGKLDFPPQVPAFLTDEKPRHTFERPLFVGRAGQLAQLHCAMEDVLGGEGRLIFITGGPGRGKTALLGAFAQQAMALHPDLLVAGGGCNLYSDVGDPYLPYRNVMVMLTADVEGRWDAGAISREHARRLWDAFPLVGKVLLGQGAHLLDVMVPGEALLNRATAAGQEHLPWLPQLRALVTRNATRSVEVEQNYLFQQFTDVLWAIAKEKPLLLILDDFQWADVASVSLLFHLLRRLAELDTRLLVVCAYRSEEVAMGRAGARHPLAKVLGEVKRNFGDVWVDLGGMDPAEGRRFVDALLDSEPNQLGEKFRATLFGRTGGHPLFTVELLRAMRGRSDLIKDERGRWVEGSTLDWEALPAKVRAVIEERIDRLNPDLQDILSIGSVEGELFTAQVVAKVHNVPERTIIHLLSQDLERRHRLVKEKEEVQTHHGRLSRYQFSHNLFQDFLYRRLSLGERRLLHSALAEALVELYEGQRGEVAVQLAHHFHQARDHRKAFHYFSLAGKRATRLFANREAVDHYSRALEMADRLETDISAKVMLLRGRGLAYETLGEFEKARNDHELTRQFARSAGDTQLEWRALIDLGKLWRSRDYDTARTHFVTALEMARRIDDPAVEAVSLNWMGNWYANDAEPFRAEEFHHEALKIVEQSGDQREVVRTLDLLGIAYLLGGDFNTSVSYYDRAIAVSREVDDRPNLITSLIGRATTVSALVHLASVPPDLSPDASTDLAEALRLAQEVDSAPDEAWACWSLGFLHTLHGHFGCALNIIRDGLKIASEIGHREHVIGNRFALGLLFTELFASNLAMEQLDEALALAERLSSPIWFHNVMSALAGVYLMLNDLESAQDCLRSTILPQTPMDALSKRYLWVRQAELALSQEDPVRALAIIERLIDSASGMEPGRVITFLWKLKADALVALGRENDALSLLREATTNARTFGERMILWRIHATLGRLYLNMGQQEASAKEYYTAQVLIDEMAATVPDKSLKDSFLQGAYGTLISFPPLCNCQE